MLLIGLLGLCATTSHAEFLEIPVADYGSDGVGYPAGIPLPPRTLSLTIDDGPGDLSLALGTWLHARGIRATFFVVGDLIEARPDAAAIFAQLTSLGHRIANHTETHARLDLNLATAADEIRLVGDRIAPFLSDGMHLFRPPFGQWNAAVHTVLTQTNEFDLVMGAIKYEINGQDWNCFESGETPTECADRYVTELLFRPDGNGLIITHEHVEPDHPTYHLEMIQALVTAIEATPGDPIVWVPLDAVPGITGGLSFGPAVAWGSDFSDAAGYSAPAWAGSLRAGDLDGDGDDDVCARDASGVYCALSDGSDLAPATLWSATFSDAGGFGADAHASSLQLGDVDGDGRADVCLRGVAGLLCETSDGAAGFVGSVYQSADFADAAGYGGSESRYRSFRLADVDGDGRADACMRAHDGLWCARAVAASFEAATLWSAALTDAAGFDLAVTGATLQLADLDGDGRADLCVRRSDGVACGSSDGATFSPPAPWLTLGFADADGFAARSRALSIRLHDVDGDGLADLCGRNATGVTCARSDGTKFRDYHYAVNTDFLDAQGWDAEDHGPSLFLGRLGGAGTLDLCGRSDSGLVCHRTAPDPDHDGIGGVRDNCPAIWNANQSDVDADGTGDVCDPDRSTCGLGAEPALLLPLLLWARKQRRPRARTSVR